MSDFHLIHAVDRPRDIEKDLVEHQVIRVVDRVDGEAYAFVRRHAVDGTGGDAAG